MASVFSGKAGRNAAMWTAGQLGALKPELLEEIQQGYTGAKSALATGRKDITSGYRGALSYLDQQYGQGAQAFGQASDALEPVQAENMAGYGMLSNALGLGGAEGTATARDAFQAGPGYQWQVEQSTDAAQRAANKVGQLYGGNTTAAVTELGSNLANQEWGNWIKNLQPYQGAANQGAQAQSSVLANLAAMYGQQGQAGANIQTGGANQKAQMQGLLAELSTTNAASRSNTINNIAGQVMGVGQQGMMAGQQAAQNRFGAAMGGLQLAGQAAGSTAGGNFLSSIFGKG